MNVLPLAQLIQKLLDCENTNESVVSEWINSDDQFEVTDTSIVEMMNEPAEERSSEDVSKETIPVMIHTKCLTAIGTALYYVEQQTEATLIDTKLLRRWLLNMRLYFKTKDTGEF